MARYKVIRISDGLVMATVDAASIADAQKEVDRYFNPKAGGWACRVETVAQFKAKIKREFPGGFHQSMRIVPKPVLGEPEEDLDEVPPPPEVSP